MIKIGRFPAFGKRFFRRARKIVGSCNFTHFWRAVMAVASMHGRRNASRIGAADKTPTPRQTVSYFLSQAQWDAPELLRQTALDTLRRLGCRPGELVYVVLDDTQITKRAKKMDAVSKIFLHAQKYYAMGHTVLGCVLIYRGVVIPYSVAVWTPPTFPGRPFRKLTQMAADAVREVTLPSGVRGIALFDAYYLCPLMISACQQANFPYIGGTRLNRSFWPDGRPHDKRRLKTYGHNVLAREGHVQRIAGAAYRLAQRVGRLSKAGRVKLVFNRRVRETSWRTLVTNHTVWSPKTILSHYLVRWGIELLFKMTKQHLGLGDYQCLRYAGVVRHLHLALIAYSLLTHLALDAPDAKALLKESGALRLPSIAQLQSSLRVQLWDDMLSSLENGTKYRAAARRIRQYLQL